MCGIIVILQTSEEVTSVRKRALGLSAKLRHRGPDWSGICVQDTGNGRVNVLAHERLAIVDPINGAQPLYDSIDRKVALAVNGEIWNCLQLRSHPAVAGYKLTTASDCEPIIPLYLTLGDELVHAVDGIFAFVVSDSASGNFLAARDPIGVMSLYLGHKSDGSVWFSSELKALVGQVDSLQEFPPGHYYSSKTGCLVKWFTPVWMDEKYLPTGQLDLQVLRSTLEASVMKRLMTDVPYGVLLSGGLDSSLVASIVTRHARKREQLPETWWPRVHTFSIGMVGSPDLIAAQRVASFLGTVHHEFHFTLDQGFDALSQVIYHIETYDVTTVRASTPMYLLARRIRAMGVKMVLSGEGADEVFGGYLYFHKAPSPAEFQSETVRKISLLSKYDCLRANKSTAAWGVEAREPFLDIDFLNVAMNLDPKEKMITGGRIEKWILRKAFDTPDEPYLPHDVLWRQKEQFSDGVGYGWIDGLKDLASREVTDDELASASIKYPYNTPTSKEALLYRRIFESHFPSESAVKTVLGGPSIACSTPTAIKWEKEWQTMADPSGRAVTGVHTNSSSNNNNHV